MGVFEWLMLVGRCPPCLDTQFSRICVENLKKFKLLISWNTLLSRVSSRGQKRSPPHCMRLKLLN